MPTTPCPEKSPGLDVAAMAGLPWLTDANSERFVLAACTCCVCVVVGGMCCSCAQVSSCAVGLAIVPPVPPLKLTRVTATLSTTVLL